MKTIVSAVALSRWYGVVMGLNNVTFSIPPGITGLVGPNGAGKSTLIRIMTGQIRPSSGELTVFDQQPWDNPQVLAEIGYCPERETLHEAFKPIPWLTALAQLSGIPAGQAKRRAQQALEQVKLGEQHWKKRIGSYSKGMRQRVKLAQAILHYPKLIILDEPMNGLDQWGVGGLYS